MNKTRQEVLLRAAYDILTRAERSSSVEEATSIEAYYDNTYCDGFCLREDIADELGIDDDTDPKEDEVH